MESGKGNKFMTKGTWKAFFIAVTLVVIGELFLAWQYGQLAQNRIPELEERVERQQQEIELANAQETLRKFLQARFTKDTNEALSYVTEKAWEQWNDRSFSLTGNFVHYEIEDVRKLEEENFQFQVTIAQGNGVDVIELIDVKKILGSYFIHSVEYPG